MNKLVKMGLVLFSLLVLLQTDSGSDARALSSGVADWPTDSFNSQRSRYNPLERELVPAVIGEPTHLVTRTWQEGSPVIVGDQLFWFRGLLFDEAADRPVVVSTDMEGNELWSYKTVPSGRLVWSVAATATIVGDIFLFGVSERSTADATQYLIALNRETGEFLWEQPVNFPGHGNHEPYASYTTTDNSVILGWEEDGNGFVGSFDLQNGTELWRTQVDSIGGRNTDFLAIADDVVIAVHFTHVAGYNLTTGEELWQIDTNLGWIGAPDDLIVVGESAIFAGVTDLVAIDVTNSSVLWNFTHNEDNRCSSDIRLATDDLLLVVAGICGSEVAGVDLITGAELWRTQVMESAKYVAMANGTVYIAGRNQASAALWAIEQTTGIGQLLTEDFDFDERLRGLSVANGRLTLSMAHYKVPQHEHTLYFFGGDDGTLDDGYLDFFDQDNYPATNPVTKDVQPLVKRDDTYGTQISIGARIGLSPATLKVFHKDGTLYKEAVDTPDKFGNGYWLVPVEYTADGYEYQVILDDGTELPRRGITMPSSPDDNLEAIQYLNGLTWLEAPSRISNGSTKLIAQLPPDFQPNNTKALLHLQSENSGMITIPGLAVGGTVEYVIGPDYAVNGTFAATAMAQSGILTAYSPTTNLEIDSPDLPKVRIQNQMGVIPQPNGGVELISYTFERTRPEVDPTMQVDAQFADVSVDPAGLQATLWVETPPFDIGNPLTAQWEAGVIAYDKNGNEVARVTDKIAPTAGQFLVLAIPQAGIEPIVRLEAIGSTLEGSSAAAAALFTPMQLNCTPGDSPGSGLGSGPNKKEFDVTDILAINLDVGGAAEAVAGLGVAGSLYGRKNLLTGQSQACAELGLRAGGGVSLGPKGELGGTLDLRGPDHAAPASSGTKIDVSASAGLGVEFSYSVPDNFGESGYGQLGLAVTLAPEADISGGITKYECTTPDDTPPRCCTGSSCPPPSEPPPGPPGNDHPDDTHSVIVNREGTEDLRPDYWRSVATFARKNRYDELARYAAYRLNDAAYLGKIAQYPADLPLDEQQQDQLALYRQNRLLQTRALQTKWGTIRSQLALMTRRQVNVLANGYYPQMSSLLTNMGLPNHLVPTDFSPASLSDGALVIPTAGLYGLNGDSTFAARLDEFVQNGGTLVVMSQPDDDGLSLLPNQWTQVGYQNDLSCYAAAMTPVSGHPLIASVGTNPVTSHVDGYISSVPPSAKMLMQRTKNGQGAFALDTYGSGYMIVTNMYDDWGRTVGQTNSQVTTLFRDVMRWAATPNKELAEGHPSETISLPLEWENGTAFSTEKIRYLLRDSGGAVEREWIISQPVAADATVAGAAEVANLPATLGIWSLTYELLDDQNEVVQAESWANYLVISDPNSQNLAPPVLNAASVAQPADTDIDVLLALNKSAYQVDEAIAVSLKISLTNPTPGAELRILVSLGEESQEKTVPAAATIQETFTMPADFSSDGLLFYGIYDATSDQSLYLNTDWIQQAGLTSTILPERTLYKPGESVTLQIAGNYQGNISVDGADFSQTLSVNGGETSTVIDLPAILSSGSYVVSYLDAGILQTSRFDVKGPLVTISQMDADVGAATVGETIQVTATVEADRALDVVLYSEVIDSDGIIFSAGQQTTTLTSGTQELSFNVPIEATVSGNVRYELYIVDEAASHITYAQGHRFVAIDALQLLSLRSGSDTVPQNDAEVIVDIFSPSAVESTVSFEMDGAPLMTNALSVPLGFSSHTVSLPPDIAQGDHTLYVTTTQEPLESRAQMFLIVAGDATFELFLPALMR